MTRAWRLGFSAAAIVALVGVLAIGSLADDGLGYDQVRSTVHDGDVIFQESRSAQSRAIRAATGSRYTHVGLVFGAGGSPYVLEAVQPVRRTPLEQWIRRGNDEHFVLMRLRDVSHLDTDAVRRVAEQFLGRDYDLTFDWSDARIYCSELVWKAYERGAHIHLNEPEPWSALNLGGSDAQALANKRLGGLPDPSAPIVTPVRVMKSDRLRQVLAGNLR
jgi:hypothetical protein